jgi:hypothetical protein
MSSSTNNISVASNKKVNPDTLFVTAFGTSYLFVRTGKYAKGNDRWFNIARCEINTDGHVDDNDGLIPDAVFYSNEEVAELVAQYEEHQERLAKAEASLREWIEFRRSWSRKGKRKLRLQKQEVASKR